MIAWHAEKGMSGGENRAMAQQDRLVCCLVPTRRRLFLGHRPFLFWHGDIVILWLSGAVRSFPEQDAVPALHSLLQ